MDKTQVLSKIHQTQNPNEKGQLSLTGKKQESIKNSVDKLLDYLNESNSSQTEKIYKMIEMILQEQIKNENKEIAFDKLNYFYSRQKSINLIDGARAETLIYKCQSLEILGLMVKFIPNPSDLVKKSIRERLKITFDNIDDFNQAFYIDQCLNARNQYELDYYAERLILIIQVLCEHSKDLWFFNQIFSVIVKSIFLMTNQNSLKQQQQNNGNQISMIQQNLIEKLIESIHVECDIYYWFTLFDIIFEMLSFDTQEYPLLQIYFVAHSIIEKIPSDQYVQHIMEFIGKYILKIKPFEKPEYTVKLFQQLLKIRPTQKNLKIISKLCYEMSKSQLYLESLQCVKQKIISKMIVDQLQIVGLLQEMVDILLFFYIGTYQEYLEFDEPEVIEKIIFNFERRIQCVKDKRTQEDETKIMNDFIEWMKHYKNLKTSQTLKKFLDKINFNKYQGYYHEREKSEKYYIWSLEEDNDSNKILIGLRNLSNTCYFNSFLQSLYMTKEFRQKILSLEKPFYSFQSYLQQPEKISEALRKTFIFLENVNKQVDFAPIIFKHALREPFRSQISQQDAGEFGSQFFEDLEIDLKENYKSVKDMFFGQTKSIFSCISCNKTFQGPQEEFLYFPLSFSGSQIIKSRLDVQRLLESCTKSEDIKMKCDNCKKDTFCRKINEFIKYPSHLLILLNRFTFSYGIKDKITNQVDLNLKLQISNQTYRLYSFILHSGPSPDSGHYYTYAQDPKNKQQWIIYDDSQTSRKSIKSEQDFNYQFSQNETPYILFYMLEK